MTSPAIAPVAPPSATAPPPEGFWRREASHFPRPLSPMYRVHLGWMAAIWRNLATTHGLMFDGTDWREIDGWVYYRLVPIGGKDRKRPPLWLTWALVRVVPSMRRRLRTLSRAMKDDLPGQYIDRWYDTWRPHQEETISRLRSVDLSALDDEACARHFEECFAFGRDSIEIHFNLTLPVGTLAELAFACEELLGWGEHEMVELLAGLSRTSTEPARRLAALAAMASDRPAVRKLLENAGTGTLARLEQADPEFAQAFHAYQREFSGRALRYELNEPTLEEVPALTLSLIHDQLVREYDPAAEERTLNEKRRQAIERAHSALASRPPADRQRFDHLLARAERYYPVREENEFFTISAPLAVMRYAALELGRRLAAKRLIAAPDDVFFLEFNEAPRALREGRDCLDLVARRKAEREWTLAHPAQPSFGVDLSGEPPLKVLPPDAAFNLRAVLWVTDRIMGAEAPQPVAEAKPQQITMLKGIPAAPGRYAGPVCVIRDESEFNKIRAGDVLVCPITSPVWSIIFPSVGALVTESGGVLSHPAIIAREYGIPAVVATRTATKVLKDGQQVLVDGKAGTVEVLSGP
ncbi:MAG: hypothetical protein KJ053_11905 [Dehalococcoidia bacterium]|nr:hypothetical protein [Dehalococcoidia bacterium]